MSAEVRVLAPAKINLSLAVGSAREDGYHPLATVYQALALLDEIVVRPAEDPEAPSGLTVSGEGVDVSEVPLGDDNLVLRAAAALSAHHDRPLGVSVHVHKRIPVAGGLAGGSTDAAASLVGIDALFGLATPRSALLEIAAQLGSDVPFCLVGGTALGGGRGELVTPAMTRGRYWWVLLPDAGGLSTPQVFGRFDALHRDVPVPEPEVPDAVLAALRSGDAEALGACLVNDLQPAALSLRPDLAERLAAGLEATAYGALVSGSGPTTAFLCSDAEHARAVAERLGEVAPGPVLLAHGPVPGARVSGGHR